MSARRSLPPQEVPHDLAALLCRLRDEEDPLLNLALAAARSKGWRTPALAATIDMRSSAVSKRVERARRMAREAILEIPGPPDRPADPDGEAAEPGPEEQERAIELALQEQVAARAHRLARAAGLSPEDQEFAEAVERALRETKILGDIPLPQRQQLTLDGKQLTPDKIAQLRSWQLIASRVNGAMAKDHPDRAISEKFSAELNRLIEQDGLTAYYLARVLHVTHRAIDSRLERHQFRVPCPSVAGTASGEYHARKIGDPGEGARRIPAELRERLQQAWLRSQDGDPAALQAAVRLARKSGFTMASIAQALPKAPAGEGAPRRHVGLMELERLLERASS